MTVDTQTIDKFLEISGIKDVGPKEALLGMSEISMREYYSRAPYKITDDGLFAIPEHSHRMFWEEEFVYIRTRPTRGSQYFIKIPSELVTKTVVLGEMPPNPIDSCVSDRLKETMKMKGEGLVFIGKAQVLLDERSDRADDLRENILSLLREGKEKLAEIERVLESLLAKAV